MVETGFIIKHCDYIFENWMDKRTWSARYEPLKEGVSYKLEDHHLTDQEIKNPFLAIDDIFDKYISSEQYTLKEWLDAALSREDTVEDEYDYHLKFMRIIEALYLINVQLYFGPEPVKIEG